MGTAEKASLQGIVDAMVKTIREAGVPVTSTNYFLHDPDVPKSLHIGKRFSLGTGITGWITQSSDLWNTTEDLIAYLNKAEKKDIKSATEYEDHVIFCWVADEHGHTYLPSAVADFIADCTDTGYTDEEFS